MGRFDDFDFISVQKLCSVFNSEEFRAFFEKALEKETSKPYNENETYDEIVVHYFILLGLVGIDSFGWFRFPDYEDCRRVTVDGKEYDLDGAFCHDDSDATNSLYAIDCLMAELPADDLECILKKIEAKINSQNQKMK